MNSTYVYCSRKTGQMLRLLFMYRTWTVTAVRENAWKKKKKKKKEKRSKRKRIKRESKHTHRLLPTIWTNEEKTGPARAGKVGNNGLGDMER